MLITIFIFLPGHVSDRRQTVTGTESQTREVRWLLTLLALYMWTHVIIFWIEHKSCYQQSATADGKRTLTVRRKILFVWRNTEAVDFFCLTVHHSSSREKELAKVTIKKEDVELVVSYSLFFVCLFRWCESRTCIRFMDKSMWTYTE